MRHATTAVLFLAAISACSKQTPSANPTAPAAKPAAADPLATPLGLANAKLVENADNPLNVAKFELGKQLFFDPRLSGTGAMACASRVKRSRAAGSSTPAPERIFRATVRFSRVSRARYTSPMPPAPIADWIS
jgi:cytochrome c peroxidase